jgi:hypothetical protein
MKSGITGENLGAVIKKAIVDGELSNSEYEEIMMIANADQVIDSQEKNLLRQLQELLSNGTVKRTPG